MERIIIFLLGAVQAVLLAAFAILLGAGIYYAAVDAGIGAAAVVALFEAPFALLAFETAID